MKADACMCIGAGVPVGADGAGGAAESIVNQTAVDVLRRLPVSSTAFVPAPKPSF